MRPDLSRREFLKLAGLGASTALLVSQGCTSAHPEEFLQRRVPGPLLRRSRGSGELQALSWVEAEKLLARTLSSVRPSEIAFLIDPYPSHLNHLVQLFGSALGGTHVMRCDPQTDLEGHAALLDASRRMLGSARLPLFDLSSADLIFSFGASLSEPWISRSADSHGGDSLAGLIPNPRIVHFSARRPAHLDRHAEWIPILPGGEALLAAALVGCATRTSNNRPVFAPDLDFERAAVQIGITPSLLLEQASRFSKSRCRLAIPGGAALASAAGTAAACWILALNLLSGGHDHSSGLFLPTPPPVYPELEDRSATAAELDFLTQRMHRGRVKVLLVHGVDPLSALPDAPGFRQALSRAECVVSLSPGFDTAAPLVDLFLPDHSPDESLGYSIPLSGSEYGLVEALVPEMQPQRDSRSSVDVLLDVSRLMGLEGSLPYRDEAEFLQRSLAVLMKQEGIFNGSTPLEFFRSWQEVGVWRRRHPVRFPPVRGLAPGFVNSSGLLDSPAGAFRLLVFKHAEPLSFRISQPIWAELHPDTAARLGIRRSQSIRLVGQGGEVRLPLVLNPGLHPAAVAVPFSAGAFPEELVGSKQTAAGGRVYSGNLLRIAD